MAEEFSADFTAADNTKAIQCGRTECLVKFFPAGTELHYLHSNDPSTPGRAVCTPCYDYYLGKKTTQRRAKVPSAPTSSSSRAYEQQVQQRIVKAQRNASAASIQHVGAGILTASTTFHTPNAQASHPSGPSIQLPGFPMPSAPPSRSQTVGLNNLGVASGYNLNHVGYQATRAQMASNAYAGNNGQIILVEVRVVRLPEGKVKPQLIGDLLVVVNEIPLHIGATELKNVLYGEILPQWTRYTERYPLSITNVIMRNKDWVELRPRNPDRDAVLCSSFFKNSKHGSQTVFKGGKALVYFHIPNNIYAGYEAWLEEREFQEKFSNEPIGHEVTFTSHAPTRKTTSNKGRKWAHTKSNAKAKPEMPAERVHDSEQRQPLVIDITSQPSSPTRSPPPKRARLGPGFKPFHLNDSNNSPDKAALDDALRAQKLATPDEVRSLFDKSSYIDVHVYRVRFVQSFDDLLAVLDWKSHFDFEDPQDIRLFLDMSATRSRKKGGFKMAYFGKSSQPLFSDDHSVCAKQSFYTKTKTVTRHDGRSVAIRQDIPYDGIKQAQDLIMEVTCLNWAHALFEMVYAFIEEWMEEQPRGKFAAIEIPQMRFVKAGLGIEQVNEGERRCFLLEEIIPESEGSFRKYLNNTSAVPCRFVGEDDNDRAEFLAFAQHVQYFKTKKRAYVADFQGGSTLLTDPQILTNGELGYIFAEGNVPETFKSFEAEHICNRFCQRFSLPSNYEDWDVAAAAA